MDLDTGLSSYRHQAVNKNPSEYLQRDTHNLLIAGLTEAVAAISKHAPDDAATLPEGLTDALANMRQDDAGPRAHLAQLTDITTTVRDLLQRLEPNAPDVPAPE
jgi:hypothetical protein